MRFVGLWLLVGEVGKEEIEACGEGGPAPTAFSLLLTVHDGVRGKRDGSSRHLSL